MPEEHSEGTQPSDSRRSEYAVESTDTHGEPRHSIELARSASDLVGSLRAEGLQVSKLTARGGRRLFEPRGVDLDEFAFFNAELASACKRGVPLPGALRALSADLRGRNVREAISSVARDVESGVDIAEALARRGDVFPRGYVALVEAGLKSGDLAGALLLCAEDARLSADVRRRVIRTLVYPLAVLFVASGLLALMGWHILPEFADMFREMFPGRDFPAWLPFGTRIHMELMPVYRWAPVILAGLILSVWFLCWRISREAGGAVRIGRLVMSLPLAGRFFRAVAVSRFCRTLASALRSGVPVPDAVTLAGLGSGNAAVTAVAEKLRESVSEGAPVSDGLGEEASIFPATVVWAVHVGEQRGDIVPSLEEAARLLDGQARRIGEVLPFAFSAIVLAVTVFIVIQAVFSLFLPMISMLVHPKVL